MDFHIEGSELWFELKVTRADGAGEASFFVERNGSHYRMRQSTGEWSRLTASKEFATVIRYAYQRAAATVGVGRCEVPR